MFNPSELEGEVDHSFFDSDDDNGGLVRDKQKNIGSPPAHESLQSKQMEKTKAVVSPRTDGTKQHPTQVNNNRSREGGRDNSYWSKEEERSRSSQVSSVASMSDKVISNVSDSEEDNSHSRKHGRTFMALLAESSEVRDKSMDESDAETSPSSAKLSGSRLKKKPYPKKLTRNRHTRSPSSTSSESSVDADSESYSSSNSGTSSSGSPTFHKYKRSTSSPGRRRRARVGSAGSRDFSDSRNKESESMTDVSPLSSPDISPLQSFDLNHGEADGGLKDEQQQQKQQQQQQQEQQEEVESVPSSGLSNIHHNETLDPDVDECSFTSESQLGGKLDFRCSAGKNRKNFSFRNDEVRRIDQENQRLLGALSRLSVGSRPRSASGKKTSKAGHSPVARRCPSALNRQREQKRIERENLALLKRLESAKPTQSLRRSEQLAAYQRHTGYLEGGTFSVSPRSAAHHRSGPVPSITPVPRSKQLGAARPAWC